MTYRKHMSGDYVAHNGAKFWRISFGLDAAVVKAAPFQKGNETLFTADHSNQCTKEEFERAYTKALKMIEL